ncbi:VanZ family protein [Streptomyces sp. NPDC058953]|uniref:VanZ family protein n=1 Tax=unclassified Streptomyces TaxID=2593676 RepID=UPI0036C496A5
MPTGASTRTPAGSPSPSSTATPTAWRTSSGGRRRPSPAPRPPAGRAAEVGMVYGTVPMVWLTLQPGPGAGVVPGRVSPIPLRDLVTMGPVGIGGNLLIFAALGFFAPMRFAAPASAPRILVLGASCSVLVETAQYVLRLDRVSSVDDVLVNAAGAVLFGLASRRWWRTAAEVPPDRPRPAPGAGRARGVSGGHPSAPIL